MTNTQLKTQIDADITNKTTADSVTTENVGENLKDIVDYVDQEKRPYKVYTAYISHGAGTGDPTSAIRENTIGALTPTYEGTGEYGFSSSGLFTVGKTLCITSSQNLMKSGAVSTNANFVSLFTENDSFKNLFIKIRVYN